MDGLMPPWARKFMNLSLALYALGEAVKLGETLGWVPPLWICWDRANSFQETSLFSLGIPRILLGARCFYSWISVSSANSCSMYSAGINLILITSRRVASYHQLTVVCRHEAASNASFLVLPREVLDVLIQEFGLLLRYLLVGADILGFNVLST